MKLLVGYPSWLSRSYWEKLNFLLLLKVGTIFSDMNSVLMLTSTHLMVWSDKIHHFSLEYHSWQLRSSLIVLQGEVNFSLPSLFLEALEKGLIVLFQQGHSRGCTQNFHHVFILYFWVKVAYYNRVKSKVTSLNYQVWQITNWAWYRVRVLCVFHSHDAVITASWRRYLVL